MVRAESLKEYKTVEAIKGPLLFVRKTHSVGYGEIVKIKLDNGEVKLGQVLDTSKDLVVVQSFEDTTGMSLNTSVRLNPIHDLTLKSAHSSRSDLNKPAVVKKNVKTRKTYRGSFLIN